MIDGSTNLLEDAPLRCLQLCLCSRWAADALAESRAISAGPDFDWTRLIQRARDEGVLLLWYSSVRGRLIAPRALEAELRAEYLESALRNTLLLHERDRVLGELRGADLKVIALKGAALAESVYGNIALRPMIDLDLLVQPHEAGAVLRQLARLGYAPIEIEPHAGMALEHENEILLRRPDAPDCQIEIHWSLLDSPYYQHKIQTDWFWATAMQIDASSTSAVMLGPEAQVLYLAAHLMLHHRGHGWLWWQDVGEVVRAFRQRIDWGLLCERAQANDLVLPLQRVLLELSDHWRLPVPIDVVERLRTLTPTAHERQVYAWLTAEHRPVVKRFWADLRSMPGWNLKLRYAWRSMFPSIAYMRWRYTLPQAWLVPLAYPYRWLLGLWQARPHA